METISISRISVGPRVRQISPAQVEALANSIADVGVLNPITVHATKIMDGASMVDGYELVAGAHRLEACKQLGFVDVPAHVIDLGDLERQIAECDENLCGSKLTPAEKALFTKRRKQAYEALHPETRNGATGVGRDKVRQVGEANVAERFTADTAANTGHSERAVQRDAERGEKISDRAIEALRGTSLDKGTYLDKLKRVPAGEQVKRVRDDLKALAKPQKRADAPLNDFEAREKQVAALMSAWNRASKEAREEFLERIDTPVFDADPDMPEFLKRAG